MKVRKYILAGLGILLGVALIWGLVEPLFVDVEDYAVSIPELPPSWEGKQVAVVADWQLGMWMDNEGTVRKAIDEIINVRPAVVLIAGDFIYHAGEDPTPVISESVELLRPLTDAGIPTYAVLGNHDYGMKTRNGDPDREQARQLEQALEEIGVKVLQNEAVVLPLPRGGTFSLNASPQEDSLFLVGIGARWPGNDDISAAFDGVPDSAPRIVMMHHPDSFAEIPANTAPLAVAGHTHGGQISLPLTSEWSWLTYYRSDEVHADGWIETDYGYPGNRLYVNRGIGFSLLPLRINCMPELTLFTLEGPKP